MCEKLEKCLLLMWKNLSSHPSVAAAAGNEMDQGSEWPSRCPYGVAKVKPAYGRCDWRKIKGDVELLLRWHMSPRKLVLPSWHWQPKSATQFYLPSSVNQYSPKFWYNRQARDEARSPNLSPCSFVSVGLQDRNNFENPMKRLMSLAVIMKWWCFRCRRH